MLKTIKTTKQMNLQELIKHVWDNGITDVTYTTQDGGARITFDADGDVETKFCIEKCDYFNVEIEEPITEDTVFDELHVLQNVGGDLEIIIPSDIHTIRECLEADDEFMETFSIYTHIGGYPIKIWERDGDE